MYAVCRTQGVKVTPSPMLEVSVSLTEETWSSELFGTSWSYPMSQMERMRTQVTHYPHPQWQTWDMAMSKVCTGIHYFLGIANALNRYCEYCENWAQRLTECSFWWESQVCFWSMAYMYITSSPGRLNIWGQCLGMRLSTKLAFQWLYPRLACRPSSGRYSVGGFSVHSPSISNL